MFSTRLPEAIIEMNITVINHNLQEKQSMSICLFIPWVYRGITCNKNWLHAGPKWGTAMVAVELDETVEITSNTQTWMLCRGINRRLPMFDVWGFVYQRDRVGNCYKNSNYVKSLLPMRERNISRHWETRGELNTYSCGGDSDFNLFVHFAVLLT